MYSSIHSCAQLGSIRQAASGRIISLACDCAGRQMSARLLTECVMAFFSLRQGRLLGDRAQPDFLRGAEPRNDVFLSLKGCCFPGSKKNDVLTEAKRLNGAFRGCVNKVHDEVVQLCVEHRAVGHCQCKARCDHPMLTLSTGRRQQATGNPVEINIDRIWSDDFRKRGGGESQAAK